MQGATDAIVSIRPLREADLDAADRIMRVAFGTFIGLPDPIAFMGDGGLVRPRWRADPSAAFAAEIGGELVGSNFAANWGSVGFFGPLTVRPDLWDRGIGSRLIEPVLERFAAWNTRHAGLFTFAHSQKHVSLYQKFGFWPRFLTAIMSKAVGTPREVANWSRYSALTAAERQAALAACRDVTNAVYDGLDLRVEMEAVAAQRLGDTLLVADEDRLAGIAICHLGAGTEAGSGACFIKFAAVRPGPQVSEHFERLLDACEAFAAGEGAARVIAGMNTARHEAYRQLIGRGFRTDLQGVAMQRSNDAGYNRPGVFLIDDWR